MKAKITNWFSNNENAMTALFCTIVFALVAAFILGIAMIIKYATVVTLA